MSSRQPLLVPEWKRPCKEPVDGLIETLLPTKILIDKISSPLSKEALILTSEKDVFRSL